MDKENKPVSSTWNSVYYTLFPENETQLMKLALRENISFHMKISSITMQQLKFYGKTRKKMKLCIGGRCFILVSYNVTLFETTKSNTSLEVA
jgi:hypothetical protein